MDQFFNVDNKFFRGVSKLVDCMSLSILWIVCCIPVFTAGAATTALYYTVNKVIRNDRGYMSSEFFRSFKANFKQSTIIWLIFMAIYALLAFDYIVVRAWGQAGIGLGGMHMVFLVFAVFVSMWGFYVFPYIARFENTTKNVLKNTALIAIANAPWTLLILAVLLLLVVGIYFMPGITIFLPVMYNIIKNAILEKVFKKYMTPEDLTQEEERNREFYN